MAGTATTALSGAALTPAAPLNVRVHNNEGGGRMRFLTLAVVGSSLAAFLGGFHW
jgi:hypothetical protein